MHHVPVEFHLFPTAWPVAVTPAASQPVRLPSAPARVQLDSEAPRVLTAPAEPQEPSVHLQPIICEQRLPRLLAVFDTATPVFVNGERAPHTVVLHDCDVVNVARGGGFRVMLFRRNPVGPPPAAVLGKRCRVCRVPFKETTTCYTCFCGVIIHCEADARGGLRCAPISGKCPACTRTVDLSEGYLSPLNHEDY